MSSFEENFTREEEEELEYDDSAFYFFSFTILFCLTLPFTALIIRDALKGQIKFLKKAANC